MGQENETIVETATTTTDQVENKSAEVVKTFTQEEVNGIVKDRLAKAQKGIPSKEELAKYNEWKESQQSQQEKYDNLVKNSSEKDHTISNLEKENAVLKAGITDQDEVEFICYKVGKMDGDFKENLTQYLADNPKYTKKQETKATGVETKPQTVLQDTGVTAILKAKHPELFN